MAIKILVGLEIINVVCVYAPQIGLPDDIKKSFGRIWIWSSKMYLGTRNFS